MRSIQVYVITVGVGTRIGTVGGRDDSIRSWENSFGTILSGVTGQVQKDSQLRLVCEECMSDGERES